jgi:hypothetical protein
MTTRQQLIKSCDCIHSRYIRYRDGMCVTCGTTWGLTCSHLFGRARLGTRWDVAPDGNCHAQCAKCNQDHSDVGTAVYVKWYVERFGEDAFDRLRLRANTPSPMSVVDLEEMFIKLQELCTLA